MRRQSGYSLLELTAAMTILTVGLLSFLANFFATAGAMEVTRKRDDMRIAFENAAELLRNADHGSLYANYHNTTLDIPALEAPGGGPAQVHIACFVDETAIPAEFGPVVDLDGDGTLGTADCSTSYTLLPVRLTLTFTIRDQARTQEFYMLISDNM
jgi:prepilin-type N-terminal cleavage/methylation domain-containing protein